MTNSISSLAWPQNVMAELVSAIHDFSFGCDGKRRRRVNRLADWHKIRMYIVGLTSAPTCIRRSSPAPAFSLPAFRLCDRPMRILFVTSNRVGDAVLSTGLLDHLIRSHPDARITVACGPPAVGVFARMP